MSLRSHLVPLYVLLQTQQIQTASSLQMLCFQTQLGVKMETSAKPGAAITELFGEGLADTLVEQPSADVVSTSSTKAGSRVSQSQWLRGGCVLPALDSILGKSPA